MLSTIIYRIMQTLVTNAVTVQISTVDYGQRFKQLRKARWKGTVLALAKALGSEYSPTIYNIEKDWRVPSLTTLAKHAQALGCQPWDLLENVEADADRVRALSRLPKLEAQRQWQALLERYERSTRRGKPKDRRLATMEREVMGDVKRVPRARR